MQSHIVRAVGTGKSRVRAIFAAGPHPLISLCEDNISTYFSDLLCEFSETTLPEQRLGARLAGGAQQTLTTTAPAAVVVVINIVTVMDLGPPDPWASAQFSS